MNVITLKHNEEINAKNLFHDWYFKPKNFGESFFSTVKFQHSQKWLYSWKIRLFSWNFEHSLLIKFFILTSSSTIKTTSLKCNEKSEVIEELSLSIYIFWPCLDLYFCLVYYTVSHESRLCYFFYWGWIVILFKWNYLIRSEIIRRVLSCFKKLVLWCKNIFFGVSRFL